MRKWACLKAAGLVLVVVLAGCKEAPPPVDASSRVDVPAPVNAPPAATYRHEHAVKVGGADASALEAMAAEFVVAVARVGDTSVVNSPYGDKQVQLPNDVTVKSVGEGQGQVKTVAGVDESLRAEKLAGEPAPPGFDQTARTQLISMLMDARCFTVIERESINDILREQEFSASGWVGQGGADVGELAAVRYIVKGGLELNPAAPQEVTPDNWADRAPPGKAQPLIFRLRMYSARTGQVVAAGDGYADTPSAALEQAVQALRVAAVRYYRSAPAAPATQP